MAALAEKISVVAELERRSLAFKWVDNEHVKVLCPFHDDHSPSLHINVEKIVFRCHVCHADGDFISYLVGATKVERHKVCAELSKYYVLHETKTINADVVERYHEALWQQKEFLDALYNRGVTDFDIRLYRLGFNDGRITIPIKDENGLFVNIRKYLPGAAGSIKFRNTKGHGAPRLFPMDQLAYDKILLAGGEIKSIVAAGQLNSHGIGALWHTAGEGNWLPEFTERIKGKTIWIGLDIDSEGIHYAEALAPQLYKAVGWLGIVKWPLDISKYPHGDINDYIHAERGLVKPILDACEEWLPKAQRQQATDEVPITLTLTQAMQAEHTHKRVQVKAVVSAADVSAYPLPHTVTISCDRSQPFCGVCQVYPCESSAKYEISGESGVLLEMMHANSTAQRSAILAGIGAPRECKVAKPTILDYHNCEDIRLSPQLEILSRESDRSMQPALIVGRDIECNQTYEMIGRMYPHPLTQQATLVVSSVKPTQDALAMYDPGDTTELQLFQSKDSLTEKLNEIYDDLESNITRIYKRREVHIATDLAYHSPLAFRFDEQMINGWTQILILGDSAQGKSGVVSGIDGNGGLRAHYGLGERVDCKNATTAGLLGACQTVGKQWMITWGVIPANDMRLVVLEEMKGIGAEVNSKLTDMRSCGIAEIDKVVKRRTRSRVRLIGISNCRGDKSISAYTFGIEAIKDLVGTLEDVRRWDLVIITSATDVDRLEINKLRDDRPLVPHRFTTDLCRKLVLWAWTRKPEEIVFDADATKAVIEGTKALGENFSDDIPLLDRGSTRHKVARLSAALAARLFSTVDGKILLVKRNHVEFVCGFLREQYSKPTFGYADYSLSIKRSETIDDPDVVKQLILATPFPREFIDLMLHTPKFDEMDIRDWAGWSRDVAGEFTSKLVRRRALIREGRQYRKSPTLIDMLKHIGSNGQVTDAPDHVRETEY